MRTWTPLRMPYFLPKSPSKSTLAWATVLRSELTTMAACGEEACQRGLCRLWLTVTRDRQADEEEEEEEERGKKLITNP